MDGSHVLPSWLQLGRFFTSSRVKLTFYLRLLYSKVVYDRQGGRLNETIIYSDDAIRPVFLIIF